MKILAITLVGGTIFGFGLALSGMTRPEVVLSFLTFDDFGLMLVMGGAIAVALPVFQLWKRPLLTNAPEPYSAASNARTWTGSILFGLGWGISGVCPGAALASLGTGNTPIALAILAMFAGAFVQGRFPLFQSAITPKTEPS